MLQVAEHHDMKITECINEARTIELLSLSIGFPTQSKVQAVLKHYQADAARKLFCCELDGSTVGCIGVALERDSAVVKQIAVAPHYQRRGVGQFMINAVFDGLHLACLEAETDQDAVGFYRKYGFTVTSLDEVHSNTERFKCVRLAS